MAIAVGFVIFGFDAEVALEMGAFVHFQGASGDVSFELGVGRDGDFSGGLDGAVDLALDIQVTDAEFGAEVSLLGNEHRAAGFDAGEFSVRLDNVVFDAKSLTATWARHAKSKGADE